jgi:hypothetical protein
MTVSCPICHHESSVEIDSLPTDIDNRYPTVYVLTERCVLCGVDWTPFISDIEEQVVAKLSLEPPEALYDTMDEWEMDKSLNSWEED